MPTTQTLARRQWVQALAFANRFEPDLDAMNEGDVTIPHALRDGANELTNLANDVVFNGGVPSNWSTTPESVQAMRAALRLIVGAANELGMLLDALERSEGDADA